MAVRDTLIGAQLAPALEVAAHEAEANEPEGDAPRSKTKAVPTSTLPRPASSAPTPSTSPTPSLAIRDFAAELPASEPVRPTSGLSVPTAEERQRFAQHLKEVRSGVKPSAGQQDGNSQRFAQQSESQPLSAPIPESISEPEPMSEPRPKLQLRPIAQITDNSYLVCEAEDGLYIVNQHRAHERILAENTIAAAEKKPVESQLLVIPFTLEVGARAIAAVEEHGHLLSQLGFEVETFGGNALVVRAVPTLVSQGDYERAFGDLLDELVSGHAGSGLEERRKTLLTMLACKNAIKAGDPLPPAAMQRLVHDLALVENPSICPHGQPILFKISSDELHKKFGSDPAARAR